MLLKDAGHDSQISRVDLTNNIESLPQAGEGPGVRVSQDLQVPRFKLEVPGAVNLTPETCDLKLPAALPPPAGG